MPPLQKTIAKPRKPKGGSAATSSQDVAENIVDVSKDWDSLHFVSGCVVIKGMFAHSPALSNMFPHDWASSKKKKRFKYEGSPPPQQITYDGQHMFASAETAYQHTKAAFIDEQLLAQGVIGSMLSLRFPTNLGPYEAKKLGSKAAWVDGIRRAKKPSQNSDTMPKRDATTLYEEMNRRWQTINKEAMKEILRSKFSRNNPEFRALLQQTGTAVVYEQKLRSGSVWEPAGEIDPSKDASWGWLGELLVLIRNESFVQDGSSSQIL